MVATALDHDAVTAAVHAAEAGTSGEIVTIVTPRSDAYHDVSLHYAVLVLFVALFTYAVFTDFAMGLVDKLAGWGSGGRSASQWLAILGIALALTYLGTRLLLLWRPLRLALTPPATKRRRVRRHAIELFRVGAEARTQGRTGILIYLSLDERMAEIVADQAIHAAVPDTHWGDAMAAMIAQVRGGRITDGMIAAVDQVGSILAAALPRASDDVNELPDRVIEL